MKKTRQVLIFLFEMLILGIMVFGLVYILRANIGVQQSIQGVDEYPAPQPTIQSSELNQLVDEYPPPLSTHFPTLEEVDQTPVPFSRRTIDLRTPQPTRTPFPTPTLRPTVTRRPDIKFTPFPIELHDSPVGVIYYAIRKPVNRSIQVNLPPYTNEYFQQPIGTDGLPNGKPSNLFLLADAVSKLGIDSIPFGVYPSPSGEYIIITHSVEPGVKPYVLNLKTNEVNYPFKDSMGGHFYEWHPDGEHFIFGVSGIGIWLVDAKTLETSELVTFQPNQLPQGAAISPDGEQVAFIAENYSESGEYLGEYLWMVSIHGSDAHPLVPSGEYSYLYPESWSPDGTQVVYTGICQAHLVDGEQQRQSLCIYDTRTGKVVDLKSDANMTTAWSPDGRYLAVMGWDPDVEPCPSTDHPPEDLTCDYQGEAIYLIDLENGENHKLVSGILPTWSPDGSILAFLAYEKGVNNVWTIRIADNELHQITTDGAAKAFTLQWIAER